MADLNNEISGLKKRIEQLETQIAFIMRREGLEIPEPPVNEVSPDVLDLLKQGKEKDAIRLIMKETGAGLKDAKKIIDKLFLH